MNNRLSHITIWQIALVILAAVVLALLITTVSAINSDKAAQDCLTAVEDQLQARYLSELNAAQLMIDRQVNESGDARINTLIEIQRHIYAADAFSMYKVSAFGGPDYMTTDIYAQLNGLIEQSIRQLNGGSNPSATLNEFSETVNTLQHAFD